MCFSRGNGKELPAETKGWKSMSCFQATGKSGCPCASEGFLVCNLAMRLPQRMDKLDKSTGDSQKEKIKHPFPRTDKNSTEVRFVTAHRNELCVVRTFNH